jgi:hypothetical protein
MGRGGMNIGNVIASIALIDLFDRNNENDGHPLRSTKRSTGNRSNRRQHGSSSFADHPERW